MNKVNENSKELVKNSLIILLGKGSTQFIVFLLLPLYTAVLTTEQYGVMDLITTYVTLLSPLISLQLENAIFRYLIDNRKDENNKRVYIMSSALTLGILLIIGLLSITAFTFCFKIKYGFYLALLVLITMISNYLLSIARGLGENIDYAKGSIIAGLTSVFLNLIFLLKFNMGVSGVFISQIISNFACSCYCFFKLDIINCIKLKNYDKKRVKELLKYSLPLVPNSVNWWIINASDKTIVSYFLGVSANGIYSVSNKFSAAFIAVYNIFNLSWSESASIHINDNPKDRDAFFSSTFNEMYKLFYFLSLLLISVLPFLFKILIDESYIEAYRYIPFLLFGSILNVIVGLLSGIYIAKKLTKEVATTSLFAAIINVITDFFLIRKIGIWAAILSTIIAFGSMTIYRIIDIRKYVNLKIDYKFLIFSFILFFVVTFIYLKNNFTLNIINVSMCLVFFVVFNKNMIKNLLSVLFKKIKR